MVEEAMEVHLTQAKKAFDAGKYSEAETILKGLPPESLKVRHNLVIVQYLQGLLDGEKAVLALRPEGPAEGSLPSLPTTPTLQYEGHETALYNLASLCARSGLAPEAITTLRSVLGMSKEIALPVLVHSLCLFQVLTRPASNLGSRPRSKSDEELIQKVLNERMQALSSDPTLLSLVTAAFADSSNLHEVFKACGSNVTEQVMYLNNLGVLSLNDGKANVASLCFTKAQKVVSSQTDQARLLHQSVAYNAALCALLKEDYDGAIHHFLSIQDAMKTSPLFWLRLAEAAVGATQRQYRLRQREEYERQQDAFAALLQTGKVYANFEFMLLPGAHTAPGPVQEPWKESAVSVAVEQLATSAVQNALFLLIPQGQSFASAMDAAPSQAPLLLYAMLYWVTLELLRRNYLTTAEVGQEILGMHERHPLPPNLHAALLSYVVEALVHLNEPGRAMKVLRRLSLASLVVGTPGEHLEGAQRSRVEALFVNLAVTHILTGSWNQAHSILDSLLAKIQEAAPSGAAEYTPEKDVVFAYQMLAVFLELAQGNQSKAAEWLSKIQWSI